MDKNSKIYVAGHRGLVGSAITRRLKTLGYNNLVLKTREQLNLLDGMATADFFNKEKPEFVFLAAAKVGGINANNTYPAQFIYENLQIQNNVIQQSYLNGVKKLLFLGSSCIYPRQCPQPIKEEYLLSGYLEPTNEPYAIAKIAGIKMCQSYNRQYGTNFIAAMPTNLYGPNDNYDPLNSHVLPALISKLHIAKMEGKKEVKLWGTGKPRRDFLFVDDVADGCVFLMNNFNPSREQNKKGEIFLNLGSGNDISIKELADLIRTIVDFKGEVAWDIAKPDGTPKKLLDASKIHKLGWKPKIELIDGIKITYQQYLNNLLST